MQGSVAEDVPVRKLACVFREAVLTYSVPMSVLVSLLPYIQIGLSVLLIAAILLQQSATGMGGAFGDNFSSTFHTRRGFEKVLFQGSIVLGILFALSALLALLIR